MERLRGGVAGGARPAHGLELRRRRVRGGGEAPRGDAQDPRAARAADQRDVRARAGAWSATPRRSGSRPRSRCRPSRRPSSSGRARASGSSSSRRRAARPDGDDVLVGRIRRDPTVEQRARALRRRRQPAQGRGAERDPDRRAPASRSSAPPLDPRRRSRRRSRCWLPRRRRRSSPPGDIASCRSSGDEATARLVARDPGHGRRARRLGLRARHGAEFRDCYSPGAAFRAADARGARQPRVRHRHRRGRDRVLRAPDARVLLLRRSARGTWSSSTRTAARPAAAARLAAAALARAPIWPRIPSRARSRTGITRASAPGCTAPTGRWRRSGGRSSLGGADVVLAGHDHHYERFAPIDGIRSFVVGTGGRSHYPVLRRLPRSQVVDWRTFGVLRLTLGDGALHVAVRPRRRLRASRDAGSGRCR